jgi:hypothetical protein
MAANRICSSVDRPANHLRPKMNAVMRFRNRRDMIIPPKLNEKPEKLLASAPSTYAEA